MVDTRKKDAESGQAQLAILMDLRDEMKGIRREMESLNRLLHCKNFTGVPNSLRKIRAAVEAPKPKKKKKVARTGKSK
jgi:hypothetical protein